MTRFDGLCLILRNRGAAEKGHLGIWCPRPGLHRMGSARPPGAESQDDPRPSPLAGVVPCPGSSAVVPPGPFTALGGRLEPSTAVVAHPGPRTSCTALPTQPPEPASGLPNYPQ